MNLSVESIVDSASIGTINSRWQNNNLPGTVQAEFQNIPDQLFSRNHATRSDKQRILSRKISVQFGRFFEIRNSLTPPDFITKMSSLSTAGDLSSAHSHVRNVSVDSYKPHLTRNESSSFSVPGTRSTSPQPHEDLESRMQKERLELSSIIDKTDKFQKMINEPIVDLAKLKKLSWHGIPDQMRPVVWQLLLGYLPASADRREEVLQRKRAEYNDYILQTFGKGQDSLDQQLYHQIHVDVLRPQSKIPLYLHSTTISLFERVLYCWAIRHPASSYVQGINDLAVPFFNVFLAGQTDKLLAELDIDSLPKEVLDQIEADTFWCLCKLLDSIQDNYTFAQPGIQRQVKQLEGLIERVDRPLAEHLEKEGVKFIQFAFRWMNCLLMREISIQHISRMWDTYFAEGTDAFFEFHLYVCAAFLRKWSDEIKRLEFQELMIFLQDLPTKNWTEDDIKMLLSSAFVLKAQFHNSPMHLKPGAAKPQQLA